MLRTRVAFTGTAVTGPALCTLFWDGATQAEADSARLATVNMMVALQVRMHQSLVWTHETAVAHLQVSNGQLLNVFTVATAQGAGTNAGDPLPRMTQGLIKYSTGGFVNGRRVIGRTYVPAPTETENSGGTPVQAYADSLLAAGNALIAGGTNLVIWARPLFSDADPPVLLRAGTTHEVLSASSPLKWAILRSRRD